MAALGGQGTRMGGHRDHARQRERGAILLHTFLAMAVVFALGALAVDFGMLVTAQSQLQTVAESAALAGVKELPFGRPEMAIERAVEYGERNAVMGRAAHLAVDGDVTIGTWSFGSSSFTEETVSPNAVHVLARRAEGHDGPIGAWFARLFGVDAVDVGAQAVAVAVARDVVIVMDRSASMGSVNCRTGEPIAAAMPPAREATQTFLRELSASTLADRVGLVSFAHRAREEAPIADLDRRLLQLLVAAGALEAEPCGCSGGTNTGQGLEVALELFEHADQQGGAGLNQRMIILVSDGLANRARGQTDCVDRWIEGHQYALEVAGEAAEEGIRIHTITLGENGQFGQMREIAIRSGGRFLRAPRPEDLNDLFLVLAREVQVALVE